MCRLMPWPTLVMAFLASSSFIAPGPARCEDPPAAVTPPTAIAPSVTGLHPRDLELLPERQERRHFVVEVGKLLKAREFDKLNAIYANLIKSRARFSNGEPKLSAFYTGVTSRQLCERGQWPLELYTMLRAWQEKHPAVLAPLLAEAMVQSTYAWEARGSGFAHTVTAEKAERYEARLVKVRELLKKALKMQAQDPQLHVMVIEVGRSSGSAIPSMKVQLEKAVAIDPDYLPAYGALGYSLLQRWYGAPGELEAFLDEVANRTAENWGEGGYAAVAMYTNKEGSAIFTNTKVDWQRMKAGFEDLRRRYPDAISFANQYCKYALFANDRETAVRLFKEIGERFDRETWGNYLRFENLRNHTLNGPTGSEGQVVLPLIPPVSGLRFHPINGRLYTATNVTKLSAVNPTNGLAAGEITTSPHFPANFRFSPDGKLLVYYSSRANQLVVQETDGDGEAIAEISLPRQAYDVAIAPDNSFLVILLPTPWEIYRYDMQDRELRPLAPVDEYMTAMGLNPDGKTLITGSQRQLLVYDLPDFTQRQRVEGFNVMMNSLVFSPDGKWLAAGGHEVRKDPPKGKILVYDTTTWEKAFDVTAHDQQVMRLRFSPDGKLLASGSSDGLVKLWNVDGWKLRGAMTDHKKGISVMDFSPDSQRLATLGFQDTRITPVSKPPLNGEVAK